MSNFSTTLKDLFSSARKVLVPIHPDGWLFVAAFAIIAMVMTALVDELFFLGIILVGWCIYFFRNPPRSVPQREGLVVSPADGVVQKIEKVIPPKELKFETDDERTRISIFLNIFNVHVQRVPIAGTITAAHYHEGAFFNAELDKASEENERQLVALKTESGAEIGFVQIAGLIARRILCDLKEGQEVVTGERYGLIRFGSRVDIYLPKGTNPMVTVGQTVLGGETIIADLKSKEKARVGKLD